MQKGDLWVEWRRTNHLILVEITGESTICHKDGNINNIHGIYISGPRIGTYATWDLDMFKRRFKKLNMFEQEQL